ncbi:MAG: hypothetical protein ONB33_10795 [candidate division KSB1 bacterium]|nr:hypothetical protein [candidate division KSB1 bacterium]
MPCYQLRLPILLSLLGVLSVNLTLGQEKNWSQPIVITRRPLGQIGPCSNLALGPDQSVHIGWIAKGNTTKPSEKDTLAYMAISNGKLYEPGTIFPSLKNMNYFESPWVIVDRDTFCHVFIVEKSLPGINRAFDYDVIEISSPISILPPHYDVWGIQWLWTNRDTSAAKDVTACTTKYLMIYAAWEDFNRIWIMGKPFNTWNWSSRTICPFADFKPPTGSSRAPHLFAGKHDTLFLAFVGHTAAELNTIQSGLWHFVHFTKKSLSADDWLEPVLVYQDTIGMAEQPILIVDQQGIRHMIWLQRPRSAQSSQSTKLFYAYSSDDHNWSLPVNLAGFSGAFGSHQMSLDSHGLLHIYWIQYLPERGRPAGVYAVLGREDQWSLPELVAAQSDSMQYDQIRMTIDKQDRLHLVELIDISSKVSETVRQLSYRWKEIYPTSARTFSNSRNIRIHDLLKISCYPSPFNESVTLTLVANEQCHLSLSIYNMMGQRVKNLLEHELVKGETRWYWDGRSDQGDELRSGIYYYLAIGHTFDQRPLRCAGKLVLIR